MQKITLHTIRTYSYHGCMPEETRIGSEYWVHLSVWGDLSVSCVSDSLQDTIDYVLLNRIVEEEMAIPAKLLEHVAYRILQRIKREEPKVQRVQVEVIKVCPPINGDVQTVSITLEE